MQQSFFGPALAGAPRRIAQPAAPATCLLDKNEQTEDVAPHFKQWVLNSLMASNWNRYPAAGYADIEERVAAYCGLEQENIVLGPGSASIIATLFNYFAINGNRLIINQPSYSLFEYHCNTYNIPFESWMLDENLSFDLFKMPVPDSNSVVIITAPNNPTGNSMCPSTLEYLLCRYPDTLFIVDAVYCEFGKYDYTPMVKEYDNLMVLRSFSKAFPVAGLRLGYLCAQPRMAQPVKKLMLPFAITDFTLSFARQVLFSPEFLEQSRSRVKSIIAERERMCSFLKTYFPADVLKVYPSQGNFLLIALNNEDDFACVTDALQQAGIRVLNTSGNALLQNSFRVSIGTAEENDAFVDCIVHAGVGAHGLVLQESELMMAA